MKTRKFALVAADERPETAKALKANSVGAAILLSVGDSEITLAGIGKVFNKLFLLENRHLPKADKFAQDKEAYLDGYLSYLVRTGYLAKVEEPESDQE